MCQLCNDSLVAAATAAESLARAAKTLYDINDGKNSKILADAAGELFQIVKSDVEVGRAEEASPNQSKGAPEAMAAAEVPKNPWLMGEDGILYLNGTAIARIVLGNKPTKH